MKKICILLSFLMLFCFTACQTEVEKPQGSESTVSKEGTESTENTASTESTESTESTVSTESTESIESTESTDNDENTENETDKIRVLTLEKALHTYHEWVDDLDNALVKSEHTIITLGQEDAKAFPEMAEVLSQMATMQENAMLDEFDNLVSTAKFELDLNRADFETYTSLLDVQVRRADSLVLSLLSDSYADYGGIENFRAFHGRNYDTQSGKELLLTDVVKNVNNDLAKAVEKELVSHMLIGEFHTKSTVEDYFANTPLDGFSWTLDYIGITFYFLPGELSEEGATTATVTFAEYPELFYEKYVSAPEEYAVELPIDNPFYTNLDADDALEEISVSGYREDERDCYTKYGVYTDTDGQYYEEDCFAYDYHPYYVKSANGDYLYLFCEDFEEGSRYMKLVVLSLNDSGSVTKNEEMNVSSSWLVDNKFTVPTNPNSFIFDDADNDTEGKIFSVVNGTPIE